MEIDQSLSHTNPLRSPWKTFFGFLAIGAVVASVGCFLLLLSAFDSGYRFRTSYEVKLVGPEVRTVSYPVYISTGFNGYRPRIDGYSANWVHRDTAVPCYYRDSIIELTWSLSPNGMGPAIRNVAADSIVVVWSKSALIDTANITHLIARRNSTWVIDNQQSIFISDSATTLWSNETVVEGLVPISDGYTVRIRDFSQLFSSFDSEDSTDAYVRAKQAMEISKTVGIILPIRIGKNVREYTFRFRLTKPLLQRYWDED